MLLVFFIVGCVVVASGYVRIGSWSWWRWMLSPVWAEHRVGIFRNDHCSRGAPSWKPGGRWGVYVLGLEIGSRCPRDPVGCWLKDRGLWPW